MDTYSHYGLLELIWSMKGEKGHKVWKKTTATGASIPLENYQTLNIVAGVSHHKLYVGVTFKPASFNEDNWGEFHAHLSYMFEHGYGTLWKQGLVSYLEIAVDAVGIAPAHLLIFDKRLKTSKIYTPKSGGVPTQYLGPRGGDRVITLYDRGALLDKHTSNSLGAPITRIEARMRRLKCSVPELQKCKNPFIGVGVCRLSDAFSISPVKDWHAFLDHCLAHGTARALGPLQPAMRKQYSAQLEGITCDWWNPTTIWNDYPSALTAVPGVFSKPQPHLHLIANSQESIVSGV